MLANRKHAGLPEANKAPRIIGQEKTQLFHRLGRTCLAFYLKQRDKKVRINIGTPP
jgi:hypothetical protein